MVDGKSQITPCVKLSESMISASIYPEWLIESVGCSKSPEYHLSSKCVCTIASKGRYRALFMDA